MTTTLAKSPEHAKYEALLPKFFQRVELQEADLIARGLPAEGYADFAKRWFGAWAKQSVDELRECMTEDCGFIDSSTFQQKRIGREITLENCKQGFDAFPDMVFYPQDDSHKSLPYADYSEGKWRVVIPWRAIARFSGSFYLPETDIKVAPTGRQVNVIGVDRYTTEVIDGVWRISHIDTDWDLLYTAMQLAPFKIPTSVPQPILRGLMAAERLLMPILRTVGRRIA